MHKIRRYTVLVTTILTATSALPAGAQTLKPTLAVVEFDAAPGGWTLPPPQIGATVAQLMLDRLVDSAAFQVFDGEWLQYGSHESGSRRIEILRANAEAAHVTYLMVGSITKFSNESHQKTIGGAGFKMPFAAGVRRQHNELAVAILVRVIDVRSGEVVATSSGSGSGNRKSVGLGALAAVHFPLAALASAASSGSRDAQLDEAVQQAVRMASAGVVSAASRLAQRTVESQ
jgi:curli biogenesis system outer membrane secretion channel CsgG